MYTVKTNNDKYYAMIPLTEIVGNLRNEMKNQQTW